MSLLTIFPTITSYYSLLILVTLLILLLLLSLLLTTQLSQLLLQLHVHVRESSAGDSPSSIIGLIVIEAYNVHARESDAGYSSNSMCMNFWVMNRVLNNIIISFIILVWHGRPFCEVSRLQCYAIVIIGLIAIEEFYRHSEIQRRSWHKSLLSIWLWLMP